LDVPSAGIGPRSPPQSALQLQQPRQQPPPDQHVAGRGNGGEFGGVAGDRAGDRIAGQKSSPPRGSSIGHPRIVKGVILPGVVLVFPKYITRGYFRRREGGEDGGVVGGRGGGGNGVGGSEKLLVGLPEGINPRCAMTVVPPSGHIQRNCPNKSCSLKGLRVLRSLNPVHPLCADRSP
jgi:hypothetical protein